jgi:hypothetical protein
MDEEFESFVVTNPDLVDPGIDVSGLRTTTDANILGNITDFPGIQYEAYNPRRLSDLMRLYSSGLPTTDTAQIPGAVDTLVNVGGGGGGMDQVTGDSVAGFDPGVTPGPSGFIGLDPDMDIDPQDFAQEDYGIYDPPELGGVDGMSGGQATPGAEFADQNPYGGTGTMDDLGADSFPEYQEPTVANLGSTAPGITDYLEGIDPATGQAETPNVAFDRPTIADVTGPVTLSQQDVIGTDANVGFVDAPATELGSKINQAFENVKDQGTSAIESFKDKLVELGGKVREGFDDIVEFGDTKIDVGRTLATGAINYLGRSIFGPVGSFLGTALGAVKDTPEQSLTRGIVGELKASGKDYGFNMGNESIGQDPFGRNPISAFGDYEGTLLNDLTSTSTTKMAEKKKEFAQDYFDKKAGKTAPQEDIGATDSLDQLQAAEKKEQQEAFADIQNQIEAEKRALQEINAAAAIEQAAAEQRARDETDARMAAEASRRAAAAAAAAREAARNQGGGDGGGGNTGGARGGGTSATSSGLGGLGFSDIRLKDNVELIGKSPSNINIYKFNYKGDSTVYEGVIANEVPWASVEASNGYLMVDYNKIDVELKKHAKR